MGSEVTNDQIDDLVDAWHTIDTGQSFGSFLSVRLGWQIEDVYRWVEDPAYRPVQIDYDGPDPSVECAYPPCTNHLRRNWAGGDQWCSESHRSLTA